MMFKRELMTGDKFYKNIMNAIKGSEPMTFKSGYYGFPEHMMLPKGSADGMRFKLFFYIGPYEGGQVLDLPMLGQRMWYGKSFGFPLDRPMQPWMLKLNNVYVKDVMIYNIIDNSMVGTGYSGYGSMMKDQDMMMMMKGMSSMNMNMNMNMGMKNMNNMGMGMNTMYN